MTYEEELEKAAEEYSTIVTPDHDEYRKELASFKAGAQWAMKYVAEVVKKQNKEKAQSGEENK